MRLWWILFTICLDWSLMWVDFTAINIALPTIAQELVIPLNTLQWIISAYTLTSAALMAVGGRLGDLYGLKRLFLIGTFIFICFSALAGVANSAEILILSRIGQGIGIAIVLPITTALIYFTFPEKQRALAFGFLSATSGIGMALGPTIGGLLITYFNWRWIFFINVPIGMVAMILASFLIKNNPARKNIPLDYLGIVLLVSGLFLLLIALNRISAWGFAWQFWLLFMFAFSLLWAFVHWQGKVNHPLIHLSLLNNKTLMTIISLRMCTQYVFFVFMFIINLYMQNNLEFSAEKAGYYLLYSTIILGLGAPFIGHLCARYSIRDLIIISCLLMIVALVTLIAASNYANNDLLIASLLFLGAAFAIHFPATNLAALSVAPKTQSALVTGLFFSMIFVAGSAGITLSSILLSDITLHRLTHWINQNMHALQDHSILQIHAVASGVQSLSTLDATLRPEISAIFIFGFSWVLISCIGLACIALIIAAGLQKINLNSESAEAIEL